MSISNNKVTDKNAVNLVNKADDLKKLKRITKGIIKGVCQKVSLSYGDELCLHIERENFLAIPIARKSRFSENIWGKKNKAGYDIFYSTRGSKKEKKIWILGTRGTEWKLFTEKKIIVSSEDNLEIIKIKVRLLEGKTIIGCEISYPDLALIITFTNGHELKLFPDPNDDFDLPYWELFTPNHMLIKVGAGKKWSYQRSDLPE